MGRKTSKPIEEGQPYAQLNDALAVALPLVKRWLVDRESFREVRIYVRPDGDYLGVLKGYNGEGTPVICFGSGFDVVSCFIGLEMAVNGDRWRKDKPYGSDES